MTTTIATIECDDDDASRYPRYAAFRQHLLDRLSPPADVLAELERMGMSDLLTAYLNWAYRFIPPRRRGVTVEPDVWASPHLAQYGGEVAALMSSIERGEDLTPRLSKLPLMSPPYVSRAGRAGKAAHATAWNHDRQVGWDKDSCLNAYGLHHLHLGQHRLGERFCDRTGIVLFVRINRVHAHVVHLGPHNFHSPELGQAVALANASQGMTLNGVRGPTSSITGWTEEERKELESSGFTTTRNVGGATVMAAWQSMSGDSPSVTFQTRRIQNQMAKIDPLLDERHSALDVFKASGLPLPNAPRFAWRMNYTELHLVEETTQQWGLVQRGML